ncbi:MAG: molybdopterin-dependent oxidoreductase [Bacillota bacterium]|nr:molybdopterin-dependent oxidoreductase [Bacillota bacterium]
MKKNLLTMMALLLVFSLMLAAGCSGAEDPGAESESEGAAEAAWTLTIVGPGGEEETRVSLESIKSMSAVELEVEKEEELINLKGALLSDILAEAGISEAGNLNLIAADGYSVSISGDVAFSENTILAYESNGEDLSSDDKNGPLRLVSTEESPKAWVGQLTTIEVE